MKKVKLIIVGAGGRGSGYARFAEQYPERMEVVGVAEPREHYRNEMAKTYNIPGKNVFSDWKEITKREKFADAMIISTQDAMHVGPSVHFAGMGYHILLEKPMAPTADGCNKIVSAALKNKIIFGVCHVMRYTKYTAALKKILDSGAIGDIVSIQHLEEVGWWHQAHSFVRGNWRNEKESSFMLLAKSCHDIDWIRYIMGVKCKSVSSFGSLKHFRKEEQPSGAAARCLDCKCERTCPYSAIRIYIDDRLEKGNLGWPTDVLTPVVNKENVLKALREGPYGRCVYECDNDVVDNQVVNMLFEGGRTVVFTMTAFVHHGRKTRIFGTKGDIYGDGSKIEIFDFLTQKTETVDTNASDATILGGHGGGDYGIMDSFIKAVAENNPKLIISGPDETLESHLMVFAAEKARRENKVVNL
ncbi:MAG: oxidoreductase [Lentisphaerae bacterium GWF2_44_16]|nr:MAG: oxidoreductase [Lentisphaerae bacterium GWF2_44_16]